MNLLIDTLPDSIEIAGKAYAIRTDYRACLRIILACEDARLAAYEKSAILIGNLFVKPPKDSRAALEHGTLFLNGGDDDIAENGEPRTNLRLYSFAQDSGMIFAAFRQTHGIDLTNARLHWWVFLALFMDLGNDTTFTNLIGLRKRVLTGKASKDERAIAREMGSLFNVEQADNRTAQEKARAAEFFRLVELGKQKKKA